MEMAAAFSFLNKFSANNGPSGGSNKRLFCKSIENSGFHFPSSPPNGHRCGWSISAMPSKMGF
jgi:hypothetical protein